MDPASLLDGLTERQAEAVTTAGAPLCILAGAGSGKTRVLTRRIAYRAATGTAEPRHVLALTFTRKAAAELGRRLEALGVRDRVAAGTFHSVAYAQLRQWWADTDRRPPTLLERKAGVLARLASGGGARVQPADLAAEIEWAKARMVGPEGYADAAERAERRPPLAPAAMASVYRRYEDEKRRRGQLDFDDLLLDCVAALTGDPAFAAAQRWRYRHLFVDEFQDVNPVQAALLACWRGPAPDTSTDLCVVGDPNQAIYSWNGADPTQLQRFSRREPGSTVVVLDDNFRSTPQILAVAGAVISPGPGPGGPLRARRPEGPLPWIRSFDTDVDEARGIARALRDRHRPGTAWSDLAVLTRTNAQLVAFERALGAAAIPCRVRGGGAFLSRPEVKAALAALGQPHAPLSVGLADLAQTLRAPAPAPSELDLEGQSRPAQEPDGPAAERLAVLEELLRLGHDYLALEADGTVAGFSAWLGATMRSEAARASSDAVELATFHGAKGLEWPVVFLAGLERGLVPISFAKTDAAIDEERRLLYVAVTRAERELHCSWTRERTVGARAMRRQPSPWLEDIEAARAALAGGSAPSGPAEWRSRLATERARLRGARGGPSGGGRRGQAQVGANADPELLAALKAWRTTAAKSGGVPAFVVFHDATLASLAEARPATREALLAVPGLGPVKAERYGQALLEVLAAHPERSTA